MCAKLITNPPVPYFVRNTTIYFPSILNPCSYNLAKLCLLYIFLFVFALNTSLFEQKTTHG